MTQIKRRPPTFILSVSQPEELGNDYLGFLTNRLRDDFDMPGVPIRLSMRKPKNPLRGRRKPQRWGRAELSPGSVRTLPPAMSER